MFFIARIVAAMFTGSCGSYNTTLTAERIDSELGLGSPEGETSSRIIDPDAKCCSPHRGQRG
ncbi:MAG: hypothetical protein DMD39_08875 [Gemmatimonadetes bacterium]|nr:MAG: hypothetical protein DMD39_08875 [Gemmatimonadota bacterium]